LVKVFYLAYDSYMSRTLYLHKIGKYSACMLSIDCRVLAASCLIADFEVYIWTSASNSGRWVFSDRFVRCPHYSHWSDLRFVRRKLL